MTASTETTELLPCPFCTAEAATLLLPTCTEKSAYNPADRAYPVVRCGVCGTEVPGENWDHGGKTAIASWNRRPSSPALEKVRTALEKARSYIDTVRRYGEETFGDATPESDLIADLGAALSSLSLTGATGDGWEIMCGDWRDELVSIHGPNGHIASGLTMEQAKALVDAHGRRTVGTASSPSASKEA